MAAPTSCRALGIASCSCLVLFTNLLTHLSQVSAAVDALDSVVLCATEAGVSAKYAKKVLKRLQRQLDIILTPARPAAEMLHLTHAAASPEQQAADQLPHPEQPHINGSQDPVSRAAAQPSSHAAENGIQQHARTGVKAQASMAPVAQPLAPLPLRKAPPPGFVRVPKQHTQQPLQGRPAWTPVTVPAAPAQLVVPPRSSAMPQTLMQPNGPAVRAASPVQQVGHCPLVALLRAALFSATIQCFSAAMFA